VIVGGYGKAPGEFIHPRGLAVTNDGRAYVLDQELGRITVFDSSGALLTAQSLRTTDPIDLAEVGDQLVVLRWYAEGERAMLLINDRGVVVDSAYRSTDQDFEIARHGEIGMIARGTDDLVLAHPQPGSWTRIRDGRRTVGNLDIEARPGRYLTTSGREARYVSAGTRGLGFLSDGTQVVYYVKREQPTNPNRQGEYSYYLAIVGSNGKFAVTRLPMGQQRGALAVSRSGHDFYLVSVEPHVQVTKYRVSGQEKARGDRRLSQM
jgi:hypothetical protein